MKHYAYYIDCATEEVHKAECPNMPVANKTRSINLCLVASISFLKRIQIKI